MSLTPDGTKKDPINPALITDCWINSTSYPNLVSYSADTDKSAYLNTFIITACGAINTLCNRYFNSQQIDQVEPSTTLSVNRYRDIVLDNKPLITVDKIWLQVVDTFAEVSKDYIQVLTREGIVRILPNFSIYTATSLPISEFDNSTCLWIRYTSGYTVVPEEVKLATSLYVDYLFQSFDTTSGVDTFSTQTYSQKQSKVGDDTKLGAIKEILKSYINYSVK